jgi:hypothetical protein
MGRLAGVDCQATPCVIKSGAQPVIPCLQNRPRLSETVAHLGLRPPVRPLGSGCVGSCCGQAWWSVSTACQRRSSPWFPACAKVKLRCIQDLGQWLSAERICFMPEHRRKFSPQFKAEAVPMVISTG